MATRADFLFQVLPNGTIFIEDLNYGRCSVTNDIEAVIAQVNINIVGGIPDDATVVYMDSEGDIDRIEVVGGKFVAFRPYVGEPLV